MVHSHTNLTWSLTPNLQRRIQESAPTNCSSSSIQTTLNNVVIMRMTVKISGQNEMKGKFESWNQYRTFADTKFSAQSNLPTPAALTICKASLCQPLAVGVLCSINHWDWVWWLCTFIGGQFLQWSLSVTKRTLPGEWRTPLLWSKRINVHRLLLQVMLI